MIDQVCLARLKTVRKEKREREREWLRDKGINEEKDNKRETFSLRMYPKSFDDTPKILIKCLYVFL